MASGSYQRRLTSVDLRTVRFGWTLWRRGLDPEQVYGLLRRVADDLDSLTGELASARAESHRLKVALRDWQSRQARPGR